MIMEVGDKYRKLNRIWYVVFVCFSATAVFLAFRYIFNLYLFAPQLENSYLYSLLLLFLSPIFILVPATKKAPRDNIPWYDLMLFLLSVGCFTYLVLNGMEIIRKGWIYEAPLATTVVSFAVWALVLEGIRRCVGLTLATVCFIFSLYPMVAENMPGFLMGASWSWMEAARGYALGSDGIIGIPMKVVGTLLIGFMIFGVAMMYTGGGKFFINLAFALLGGTRGGPAKVAIVASSLFGSLSGSPVANVLTTGSMTIPTMKRTGYPDYFAAAVESCSSSAGSLMPPIMGAAAFIMASFLVVPYWQVAVAAAIPSLLYYLSLFIQVDARAVKMGLKGLDKSNLPLLGQTIKEGWIYIFAFAVLVYLLFFLRHESEAPFYATALLIAGAMIRKETRFNLKTFFRFIAGIGRMMMEITGILAAVGLIIGGLSMTGVAMAFSRELVLYAQGNVYIMLALGAITCLILGMGMPLSAIYIFLALVLAPSLTKLGLNVFAVHLFIMYWAMMCHITPPYCCCVFAAATIAGAPSMKTAFAAMRLGTVMYIIPFLFVLDPALVSQAPILEILLAFSTCAIGVILIAGAVEGYLIGLGKFSIPLRVLTFGAGILLALSGWLFDCIGLAITILAILVGWLQKRRLSEESSAG